jgi:hypothetical protein
MIITKPGKYEIVPITLYNAIGNPYQLREAEITEVDKVNQKVYCPDLGWVSWDLPVKKEDKKGGKKR